MSKLEDVIKQYVDVFCTSSIGETYHDMDFHVILNHFHKQDDLSTIKMEDLKDYLEKRIKKELSVFLDRFEREMLQKKSKKE